MHSTWPLVKGVLRFAKPMVDVVLRTDILKAVGTENLAAVDHELDFNCGRTGVAGRSEVGSVIGEHGVDLLRNDFK